MTASELRALKVSFLGHLVALGLLACSGWLSGLVGCERAQKEMLLPVEFIVQGPESNPDAADPSEVAAPHDSVPDSPPEPDDVPEAAEIEEPTPIPEPTKPKATQPKPTQPKPTQPKPTQKPKPTKKPIVTQTNIVTRTVRPTTKTVAQTKTKPSTPRLSEREIRSMLGGSGTSSSGPRTSPSGNVTAEDAAYMARIKKAFNDSWRRPTADQRGSRPALVEVRLDAFGHVISANLTQSSGSPGMDATVSSAAKAVRFVPNPPKGFSRRYPALTVEFILE